MGRDPAPNDSALFSVPEPFLLPGPAPEANGAKARGAAARNGTRKSSGGKGPRVPSSSGTSQQSTLAAMPAQVILESSVPHLDREFDYAVPEELDGAARPGVRVKVRFSGQELPEYIVGRNPAATERKLVRLGKLVSTTPVLTPAVLELARAVAARYAGSVSDVLRLAIPPRVAKVDKEFEAVSVAEPRPAGSGPAGSGPGYSGVSCCAAADPGAAHPARSADAWHAEDAVTEAAFPGYPEAKSFLAELAAGENPRAALTTFRGFGPASWTEQLAAAFRATLCSGRGVLAILPDQRELDALHRVCARYFGDDALTVLSAEHGPTRRYRSFLQVLHGERRIVLGLRAAMFAPVPDLGLLVCWDDGNDLLAERRAPYQNAREVLLLRAQQQQAALLLAGHARSTAVQRLVSTGWIRDLLPVRPELRRHTPRMVNSRDSFESEHDPLARKARIPQRAWQTARSALAHGPVLVQVARAGYAASLACSTCRAAARCRTCTGPLTQPQAGGELICRWCASVAHEFTCEQCGGHEVRRTSVGIVRTAEELGRAFPGVTVVSSSGDHVKDAVPDAPALVVATAGAEPVAEHGYSAALLLDGDAVLAHAHLNAAEEALRRWLNAAALVKDASAGGAVVLVAPVSPAADALIRWDPAGFAERELEQRRELSLPPSVRFASITGPGRAVELFCQQLALPPAAQILGPVPVPAGDLARGSNGETRMLIFFPYAAAADVTRQLRATKMAASAKRIPPVQVKCDPADVL